MPGKRSHEAGQRNWVGPPLTQGISVHSPSFQNGERIPIQNTHDGSNIRHP